MRDIIKKLPKKRGYRFASIQEKPFVINLAILDKAYVQNEEISPATLISKGLMKLKKGKVPKVKILGSGSITKKVVITKCQFSKVVEEKIKKVGGEIK